MPISTPKRHVHTVSELTGKVRRLLEETFPFVWVSGEISNLSTPLSGHLYFTLKDEAAQISAVMFRGQRRNLSFEPASGAKVVGFGRISVYEPRGAYQLLIEHLEPAGLGALQAAFEALKQRLSDEGLFGVETKKPIPFLPKSIGIITSPSGAVIHDMIHVLTRRHPGVSIRFSPVRVQGDGAAGEIVQALSMFNSHTDADVLILARGGGSLEDLQAFNSETVARAIFASRIPVVSAVGHETDYTISDFTADLRAPTPSAAAELVVPVRAELAAGVARLHAGLLNAMQGRVSIRKNSLAQLSRRLKHPSRRLAEAMLRTDDLTGRMIRAMTSRISELRTQAVRRQEKLARESPANTIKNLRETLEMFQVNSLQSLQITIIQKRHALEKATARLQTLNPLSVLQRGYSISRLAGTNKVVTDAATVREGQKLDVVLAKGALDCLIEGTHPNGRKNI